MADGRYYDPEIFKASGPTHSGAGRLTGNVLVFLGFALVFTLGIYALGFYPDAGPAGMCAAIGLFCLPWALVYHLLPSKTNRGVRRSGTELTQL